MGNVRPAVASVNETSLDATSDAQPESGTRQTAPVLPLKVESFLDMVEGELAAMREAVSVIAYSATDLESSVHKEDRRLARNRIDAQVLECLRSIGALSLALADVQK